MVRLTDHPDMTLDVYRGCKTTMQHQLQIEKKKNRIYFIDVHDFCGWSGGAMVLG